MMKIKPIIILILLYSSICYSTPTQKRDWALNAFKAQTTDGYYIDIVFTLDPGEYVKYHLYALTLSKVLASYENKLDFELEGQLIRHLEDPFNYELNTIIVLRWVNFWWDDYLDTSLALGNGFSYALKTPEYELISQEANSKLLHCLMAEVAVGVPFIDNFELILRVHHRSGFWGLFNASWGGSNHIGFGLKYLF